MDIFYSPTLLTTLKNKYLLLDTNIFRDASSKPSVFREFFNTLKRSDIALVTIDHVRYELLAGSASIQKYQDKYSFINEIIDACLPLESKNLELVYELIKKYEIDGAGLSVTDLLLGSYLAKYKANIFLMTRDSSDFISRLFNIIEVINIPLTKGLFSYGIYQYKS